jgi:hypothetical protein
MTEVANEVMCKLPRQMNVGLDKSDVSLAEIKKELSKLRGVMSSAQGDIHDIFGILARKDDKVDRADRRVAPRELAEAQARSEHVQ